MDKKEDFEFILHDSPPYMQAVEIARASGLSIEECEQIIADNPTKGIVGNLEILLNTRKLSDQAVKRVTEIVDRCQIQPISDLELTFIVENSKSYTELYLSNQILKLDKVQTVTTDYVTIEDEPDSKVTITVNGDISKEELFQLGLKIGRIIQSDDY